LDSKAARAQLDAFTLSGADPERGVAGYHLAIIAC